ncbi:MAG: LysR family transcriptional regulator [Lactobacillaceae bacterium]|uniref:LysR family transcriptional regulator n=1 Tax=Limosilactobacillus sp. TaxID=2773925 RepID=UPI002A75183A|nr:LysR family transcriptional regulator [Limosilactobacillus sp.]MDD7693793.1 LysR family transcriptional regulator [Lactobacillaceae bacterium]MDY2802394.1 LysR family transcriptional regulator [Limosilactobacillus sp.]
MRRKTSPRRCLTTTAAGVVPGPPQFIEDQQFPEKIVVNHHLIQPNDVLSDLRTRKERLIFTIQEIEADDVESMYLGQEYLGVGIDKFNPHAQKKQLSFADPAGLSFLVVQDIGPWRKVVEDNIPDATFLYQEDLKAMSQISRYSNFPFFFSNLTQVTSATESRFGSDNRNAIEINDPHNHLEIYGTYLKSERRNIQPLLKELAKKWPK